MYNSLNHFKSVFTHQFFVRRADQNYFLARWARIHSIHTEFYWQALQAIEKYLKASLVLNGVQVKSYDHRIDKLFTKQQETLSEFALEEFKKPENLPEQLWNEARDPDGFVRRILISGIPDSRYGLTSYMNLPDDFFKLDQFVFHVRRLCVGLDWVAGNDWDLEQEIAHEAGNTFRTILHKNPSYQVRGQIQVPEVPAAEAGDMLPDSLYAWNFSFFRHEKDLNRKPPVSITNRFGPGENSRLFLLYKHLEDDKCVDFPFLLEGAQWLIDNVKIGKASKDFQQRINELRGH